MAFSPLQFPKLCVRIEGKNYSTLSYGPKCMWSNFKSNYIVNRDGKGEKGREDFSQTWRIMVKCDKTYIILLPKEIQQHTTDKNIVG
jgi:hypothetical protein